MIRSAPSRPGMTMVEILVAVTILMVVSAAMLGVLMSATRIFEAGQASRVATDEVMAIAGLLDADLAAAIPPRQGGRFYAKCSADGSCRVGWTISDPSSPNNDDKVAVDWSWDKDILTRKLFAVVAPDKPQHDTTNRACILSRIISSNCLFFSVALVGTCHDGDLTQRSLVPVENTWWRKVQAAPSREWNAEPLLNQIYEGGIEAKTLQLGLYPLAARFTFLLLNAERQAANAATRVYANSARLLENLTPSDQTIRIFGQTGVPTGPGQVCVIRSGTGTAINQEVIGYHGFDGSSIQVNAAETDGPLGEGSTGRGVLRTTAVTHDKASSVVLFPRALSMVRALPP